MFIFLYISFVSLRYKKLYGIISYMGIYWSIVIMVRVFTSGPGDQDSIPGRVISKTQKMVLDASLFNTQYYKV